MSSISLLNKPLKIAFLENHLNVRGTTIALYDYAHFNEELLDNQSFIITRKFERVSTSIDAMKEVYDKFEQRFSGKVLYYETPKDIQTLIDTHKFDILYIIKGGGPEDGLIGFTGTRVLNHCVFETRRPHGDVSCCISPWLNIRYKTDLPVLPHIVRIEGQDDGTNLLSELGIPEDAIVFGRYGGYDEFDIPDAQRAVDKFSQAHPNVYFLFMHTRPFCTSRKNIIHLTKQTDGVYKHRFINSCNAMIYARKTGESFGLSVLEFSLKNKPVIATYEYPTVVDFNHAMTLNNKGLWYKDEATLIQLLESFIQPGFQSEIVTKTAASNGGQGWNQALPYSPENVMKIFDAIITYQHN